MAERKRTASRASDSDPSGRPADLSEPDTESTTGAPAAEPEPVGGKASANAKQREIERRIAEANR